MLVVLHLLVMLLRGKNWCCKVRTGCWRQRTCTLPCPPTTPTRIYNHLQSARNTLIPWVRKTMYAAIYSPPPIFSRTSRGPRYLPRPFPMHRLLKSGEEKIKLGDNAYVPHSQWERCTWMSWCLIAFQSLRGGSCGVSKNGSEWPRDGRRKDGVVSTMI